MSDPITAIVLFTDFGAGDPYVGQVKAALARHAPDRPVIDLLHTAPDFDVLAAAHLLAALQQDFPAGTIFLCAVDPGVGGPRHAAVLRAGGKWFVGPDNGLMSVIAQRARGTRTWRIDWKPAKLSASFHARDLFAPIAGALACGELDPGRMREVSGLELRLPAGDLARIVYIDHYGNAMTGLRAGSLAHDRTVTVRGRALRHARVFSESPPGEPFWYENSIGLIELAANRASAAALLGVAVGDPMEPQRATSGVAPSPTQRSGTG